MFWTYILKSLKDGKYYYGHASDLESRLMEHNKGRVKSTKSRRPFIIHYFENFDTKSEAAKRELFFKSINGYIFLKKKQNYLKWLAGIRASGRGCEEPVFHPLKTRFIE